MKFCFSYATHISLEWFPSGDSIRRPKKAYNIPIPLRNPAFCFTQIKEERLVIAIVYKYPTS